MNIRHHALQMMGFGQDAGTLIALALHAEPAALNNIDLAKEEHREPASPADSLRRRFVDECGRDGNGHCSYRNLDTPLHTFY
jgi:hypothetical protein